jgi:transcription-repair coupling factor (superfamily II helicase)
VIIGHGRMREDRLEEVMHAFSSAPRTAGDDDHRERLGIPSVSIIIVSNAGIPAWPRCQLRGRVVGAPRAYAYFHSPNRVLTEAEPAARDLQRLLAQATTLSRTCASAGGQPARRRAK